MGRARQALRWLLAGWAFVSMVAVPVVAAESWREYVTWQDRPLGVLDVVYGVAHADLPPAPAWTCGDNHAVRLIDGRLAVRWIDVGPAASPLTRLELEEQVSARLGVPVTVADVSWVPDVDAARVAAASEPRTAVLVFHDGYFEGGRLHERIEGLACDNVALVNAQGACVEGIAAHELGHVLGLGHAASGLMRARAAACDATLSPHEMAWLLARSGASVPGAR